ncbi:MAG: acyltransferase family protein [Methanosarcina sp.]
MEQTINTNQRDPFLDIIKGITIFLVVFGHCIQYGSGTEFLSNGSFFYNVIFKIIYSFHMPLFMLVSGYLFYYSIKKHSIKELLFSRITLLIVPIFAWNGLYYIAHWLFNINNITISTEMISYLKSSFTVIWFLWAIFYCSMAVIIVNKFFKDNIIIYILGFVATFIIPDSLGLNLYKFMYPYFVTAYLYNKNQNVINNKLLLVKDEIKLIATAFIYIVLMLFYDYNSYIYTSGYTILGKSTITHIEIDLYRMVIGFFGSILVFCIVRYLMKKEFITNGILLSKLGISSLGIYIISGYIITILTRITTQFQFNYGIALLEAIIITVISYAITITAKHFNATNILLLGGR